MNTPFRTTYWLSRMLIIIIGFGLFSCAKPAVVIRKPTTPVKKETTPVVVKNEEKPIEKEKSEDPVKETPILNTNLAKAEQVLSEADKYMGTPHRMGGLSKSGIDCSGLVVMSYKKVSLPLPRSTRDQINSGKKIKLENIQKGDLVFFTYPGGTRVTHVGMVHEIKGPKDVVFIHTSSSRGVRKDNIYSDYWKPLFLQARRVL